MAPWLLLAPALAVSTPTEIPDPRNEDGWLVDQADVLDAEQEKALSAELRSVLSQKGAEVLVVTVDTVEGDPSIFADELFRQWAPGRVNQDRGALIVVVEDSKALMVNAGIGLMADLTNPWVQQMQSEVMIPALQKGDIPGALAAGVAAIRDRVGASTRAYADQPGAEEDKPLLPLWVWITAAGAGVLGLLWAAVRVMAPPTDDEVPDLSDLDNRKP